MGGPACLLVGGQRALSLNLPLSMDPIVTNLTYHRGYALLSRSIYLFVAACRAPSESKDGGSPAPSRILGMVIARIPPYRPVPPRPAPPHPDPLCPL